jgi:hypothetical protein
LKKTDREIQRKIREEREKEGGKRRESTGEKVKKK